jgi:hypothetical protein
LAVLGDAKGKQIEPADLERAFGQRYSQRMTDARGFARIGRWKIYIEESLPRTPIQLSYWDVIRSSGLHPSRRVALEFEANLPRHKSSSVRF